VADKHPEIVARIKQVMADGRTTPELEGFKIKQLGDK